MPSSSAQTFKNLLLIAIANLKLLLKLLDQEKQLLETASAEPEDISKLSEAKTAVLTKIEADIIQRNEFLQLQGLEPNEEGLNKFLAKLPTNLSQPLGKGWQQLNKTLEEVQLANNINGQLINRATQHYDALINAVKATQNKVKVYNPKGGAGSLNTARNLGSA